MLKISAQQLKAFSKAQIERFEVDAAFRLKKKYPVSAKDIDVDQMTTLIRAGLASAERYGITESEDMHAYLEYMVVLGKDFDTQQPWAPRILKIRNLDGTEKITRIKSIHTLNQEFE